FFLTVVHAEFLIRPFGQPGIKRGSALLQKSARIRPVLFREFTHFLFSERPEESFSRARPWPPYQPATNQLYCLSAVQPVQIQRLRSVKKGLESSRVQFFPVVLQEGQNE